MPTQAKAEKIEELTDKLGRAAVAILVQIGPQARQGAVAPKPTCYESGLPLPPLRRSPAPLTST